MNNRSSAFERIFSTREWGGESVSGPGSSLDATDRIRRWLPAVLMRFNIRSMNDAPCGDGIWFSHVRPSLETYRGFDIVPQIIETNRRNPIHTGIAFEVADVVTDILPQADAVFCRDCLVHLPFDQGRQAIANFKASGTTYLIATTFARKTNVDVKVGGWRPINLEFSPYDLGSPLELFFEREPDLDDKFNDKAMGIWRL